MPADALQFIQNSSAGSRPSSPPLPVITSPAEVSLYVTSLLVTVNPLPVGVGSVEFDGGAVAQPLTLVVVTPDSRFRR